MRAERHEANDLVVHDSKTTRFGTDADVGLESALGKIQ